MSALDLAEQRGYLYSKGPKHEQLKLERAWRRTCFQQQRPYIVGWKNYSYRPKKLMGCLCAELTGAWWLSRKISEAVRREFEPDCEVFLSGNTAMLRYFPHGLLDALAGRLLDCLERHRPSENEAFSRAAPLSRGLARCVDAEGMEHCLQPGTLYYIRECPNMPGHVVALASGTNPVVGVHLERFDLL